MRRILDPLQRIGARTLVSADGRLPLTLAGARDPMPIVFEPPVPSAQLKSATLLAGLAAPGETVVIEAEATRDHTEKMLAHFGAEVRVEPTEDRRPPHHAGRPAGTDAAAGRGPRRSVFGGISAGRRAPRARLGRDPRRRDDESAAHRPLHDARRDGRAIERLEERNEGGEDVADLRVRAGALRGVEVPAARAPSMIDEYPVLPAAAAFAEGTTRDARAQGTAGQGVRPARRHRRTLLRVNGVAVDIEGDDLIVHGKGRAAGGGLVTTHMDHRIAMAAIVLGLASERPVQIDDGTFIATSFPGFVDLMRSLGADLS